MGLMRLAKFARPRTCFRAFLVAANAASRAKSIKLICSTGKSVAAVKPPFTCDLMSCSSELNEANMHFRSEAIFAGMALAISLFASPSVRADDRKPCLAIKDACEKAGFKQGAAGEGTGLQVDCIRPIIDGASQRKSAGLALPTVDADTVAACKAKNPEFGKPRLNGQPGPATSGSDF
jgi:hypothetical protein